MWMNIYLCAARHGRVIYRVLRLIDSEFRAWERDICGIRAMSSVGLYRSISLQTRNAPIWTHGKKRETLLSPFLFVLFSPSRSREKRANPAKFAGGSFDLWRKFLVVLLCRISWSCCSPFPRPLFGRVFACFFFFPFSFLSLFFYPTISTHRSSRGEKL